MNTPSVWNHALLLARRGAFAGLAVLLSACGNLNSARMWAPAAFGMDTDEAQLHVEPAMSADQRLALQRQIMIGRGQVERFFGQISTEPYFVACATDACALRFGSYGEPAAAFGDLAIRLTSPRGFTAPLVAHEWSHVETYRRAGGWWRMRHVPRWFDEGLAVVVAAEPRHSEANWREIQRRGVATPALSELVSRSGWVTALRKYGEIEIDDPNNLRAVYSTAGHELRQWLACAGPPGAVALLAAVQAGESFDLAYRRIGGACAR